MDSLIIASGSALWLGILTSISPCPLATNIAAISFIGRQAEKSSNILLSGLSYTFGRMIAYLVLAILVIEGLLSIPGISNFLQRYMNLLLGPVLIVAGFILFGWFSFSMGGMSAGKRTERLATRGGILGACAIGFIFALSLCPVSAALFFGSLVPLSLNHNSRVLLPSIYGIGTGLPVVIFGFLFAFGTQVVARAFRQLSRLEKWLRYLTAIVFILVGIYYSLIYIFKLPI
ncbi:Cytochrome c biogenesis protein, transmembrane region [Candidatus Zixiibacteriota bacterium]|nr:Cytochrome c biogenesis protein, transmembrane region [candidate division Zixibacteria bacterium]